MADFVDNTNVYIPTTPTGGNFPTQLEQAYAWGTPAPDPYPPPTPAAPNYYEGAQRHVGNGAGIPTDSINRCSRDFHHFACRHEEVCECGACRRVPPAIWEVPKGL